MSQADIKSALETALGTISPAIDTAYENTQYKPVIGAPYQDVNFTFSAPLNDEYGPNYQENGYMQVTLRYPQNVGTKDIDARIALIRDKFKRGASFTKNGITTVINRSLEVRPGFNDGDRFVKPVFIRFYANIGS